MSRKRKHKGDAVGPKKTKEGYKEHAIPQEDPERRSWEAVNETTVGQRGEDPPPKKKRKVPPGK